ncbi:corticoliberin-like [Lethenteron reissneri]|uniref:corticoliberin-like n=1 Tax=Lethenteron reissneri TaxID=7753 RepID=UPI002AB659AA|nr:corticoliberin-like [Lethenteron reissneri]
MKTTSLLVLAAASLLVLIRAPEAAGRSLQEPWPPGLPESDSARLLELLEPRSQQGESPSHIDTSQVTYLSLHDHLLRLLSRMKYHRETMAGGVLPKADDDDNEHRMGEILRRVGQVLAAGEVANLGAGGAVEGGESDERPAKRSDEPPISLDLTFHLLREVLEMAKAEQLAQQAHTNRQIMENIGK